MRAERGSSLLEMLFVVALLGIVSAIAVLQISTSRPSLKGDGAMRVVLSQVRTARELAITQRRYMRIVFTTPNQVQIVREEVPGPATTVVSSTMLEDGVQFALFSGVPDTPDAFGETSPIAFGSAINVKFSPDGTLVNQDGTTANGSVFLAIPTAALSVRAVTVLGSTGRVRAYRWVGNAWKLV